MNKSHDKFWGKLLQKEPGFVDLASFALGLLSLPHSNAECERVFSKVNLFKTKQRNRLKTSTVNGAFLSASCIKGSGGSCVKFPHLKRCLPVSVIGHSFSIMSQMMS